MPEYEIEEKPAPLGSERGPLRADREALARAETPTAGHVWQQVHRSEEILDELVRQVDGIEARLVDVLAPDLIGLATSDEPVPQLAPLAENIRSRNDRLDVVVRRLAALRERIEV